MKPYRFHPAALAEYQAAIDWYAERSLVAATGLSILVERGIQGVREHPLASPAWPGLEDVRRRILRGYPYSIIYLVEPAEIVILGVAHHKRRPGYWLERTGR